jgi:hypothetical protein
LHKKYHAGLVFASPRAERVEELMEQYSRRFYEDFFTTGPPLDRANA